MYFTFRRSIRTNIESDIDVLISGAGLGGLALAQALRKQGISYEIFERDMSERERRPGWVIGLHQ